MKVLLVDDEQSITDIFGQVLTKAGYELVTAGNGKDALTKAAETKPDVILLDQILPDISGNDVLKALKTDDATKNIPVAMLSNYSDDNMMKAAINQGATDYILKYQIEPNDLIEKVKQVLQSLPNSPTSQTPPNTTST